MEKNRPQIFFSMEEGISIRNYLRNPIKMVRILYKYDFWCELVVFVVKKVEKKVIFENMMIFGCENGVGGGSDGDDGGGGSDSGGGGGDSSGGSVGGGGGGEWLWGNQL